MNNGIVRRIDELGRVVIPKELRRSLHLREGEEIEVSLVNGELLLRKHSPLQGLGRTGKTYAELLKRHTGYHCMICDNDTFVVSTLQKDKYEGKAIPPSLEKLLLSRRSGYFRGEEAERLFGENFVKNLAVCPILSCGDVLGGILLVGESGMVMPDILVRFLEIGADFLSLQV